MRLALHRSITFWAGLLVMGFVCLAWWDSTHLVRFVAMKSWGATNADSGLSLTYNGKAATLASSLEFGQAALPPVGFERCALHGPLFTRGGGAGLVDPADWNRSIGEAPSFAEFKRAAFKPTATDAWDLYLPHWLVLLAVLIPWVALLLWRARRRRGKIAV